MILEDTPFHDAMILAVTENTYDQSLDFLLDFPVDWENNVFEKRTLRLKNVVVYIKKEIPFIGPPTILGIKTLNNPKHTYRSFTGEIATSKYKIEIQTNAGVRFVEFTEVELI